MQFGTYGHLETNGFAKHMTWTIEEDPPKILQKYPSPKTKSFVDLLLLPSQNTNRIYPYTYVYIPLSFSILFTQLSK